jgi:hypothetical protein
MRLEYPMVAIGGPVSYVSLSHRLSWKSGWVKADNPSELQRYRLLSAASSVLVSTMQGP